ncbi:MAG: hypothetical protein ACHP65_07705 [Legionellales bacterium]
MNNDSAEIECLVKDFLACLCLLNQCMLEDQSHFSVNDFVALEQSDLSKSQLNANLRILIDQLAAHAAITGLAGDLFEKLSSYADTLAAHQQSVLLELIHSLRKEYQTGLQLMHLNRQVVHANLTYVKELFSHLTQSPPCSKSTVYDQSAAII